MSVQSIAWTPTGAVRIVDQTALPEQLVTLDLETAGQMAEAIRRLRVRGAPLIGIAAAMGLVAGLREHRGAGRDAFLTRLEFLATELGATRPTAVNLHAALARMRRVAAATPGDGAALWDRLAAEARAILEEDRGICRRIGEHGLGLLPEGAQVLTHCNTGALATGGVGTALAPVYLAHEAKRRVHVWVSETRPLLQGARLTAWELRHAGIPCTLVTDSMAGALMRAARVDLVLVGADRVAANGDFANKIGTYQLAVLALHHGVPLYCVAPTSSIDPRAPTGDAIPIEYRAEGEVTSLAGRAIAPPGTAAWNPAFDVTPARYVTGFLTERGLVRPPFAA
jgi:methylthioribose-1-phosphate isomerase